MTSPHALVELAERCERAMGRDLDLDREIALAAGWIPDPSMAVLQWTAPDGSISCSRPPQFTSSLDAALTLVPEGAGFTLDRYWIASVEGPVWSAHVRTGGTPDNPARIIEVVDARSAALATTAAALRALALSGSQSSQEVSQP